MEKYKCFLNRNHRKADYPYMLETISGQVCQEYGISINELKKRGRNDSRGNARVVFCCRLHIKEFIPLSVIAGFLGTTISPIAVLVQKGATISEMVSV